MAQSWPWDSQIAVKKKKKYTVENNDVSSANSFTVDCKFSGRSFIYIRKSNGPKIELCWTPASTDD